MKGSDQMSSRSPPAHTLSDSKKSNENESESLESTRYHPKAWHKQDDELKTKWVKGHRDPALYSQGNVPSASVCGPSSRATSLSRETQFIIRKIRPCKGKWIRKRQMKMKPGEHESQGLCGMKWGLY